MIPLLMIPLLLFGSIAAADTIVATRTMRAQEILSREDLSLEKINVSGGLEDMNQLIGKELRTAVYAGRPIRATDVREPALVERNQIIPLNYVSSTLMIQTDGRVLDRASQGEWVRVMNLSSKSIVSAMIGPDGMAYVK